MLSGHKAADSIDDARAHFAAATARISVDALWLRFMPQAFSPDSRRDAAQAVIRVYPEKSCGMLRHLRDAVASNPGHKNMLLNVRSKFGSAANFRGHAND